MPTRLIRDGILTSAKVNRLSMGAELLYRRLMSVVDDYGRYFASPSHVRPAAFPLLLEESGPFAARFVSADEVAGWLQECIEHGLLRHYLVEGVAYVQFENFGQQQRSKPKFPAPPDSPDSPPAPREKTAAPLQTDCKQSDNRLPNGPESKMRSLDVVGDVVVDGVGESAQARGEPLPFPSLPDLSAVRRRINGWFRVPADTPWHCMAMDGLSKAADWGAEQWDLLERFMIAPLPADADKDHPLRFRRRDPQTFAQNVIGELAKAEAWAAVQPVARATRSQPRHLQPPCPDWATRHGDALFGSGWPATEWARLDQEAQLQIWTHHDEQTAAAAAA